MKALLFLSISILFNSSILKCSNEEPEESLVDVPIVDVQNPPCSPGELSSTSLEQIFGCSDTRYNTTIDLKNTYTLIRSQSEFTKLATSVCAFNIDFTNYDLIIGKKQLMSGNHSISYEYTTTDCITKKLKVIFQQNEAMNAPNITYHRLVPKIGNSETLIVETIVK